MSTIDVIFVGGPRDGQQRKQQRRLDFERTGFPGAVACVTEAHAKGMHGIYTADRNHKAEPYRMVWREVERGNSKRCRCGCGGWV